MRALAAVLLLFAQTAFGQADEPKLPRVVDNPASTFLEEWKPIGNVLELRVDFNRDGLEDVAYVDQASLGHRGNGSWDIFLRRHDGKYVEVGVIEYRSHLLIHRRKKGGAILKTYIPGGVIISYSVSEHGLKEIGTEDIKLDVNGYRIEQVFGKDSPEYPIKYYTSEEFKKKGS